MDGLCIWSHVLNKIATVDVEIFMGEIFRGLNFQEIKFSWMVAPTKI